MKRNISWFFCTLAVMIWLFSYRTSGGPNAGKPELSAEAPMIPSLGLDENQPAGEVPAGAQPVEEVPATNAPTTEQVPSAAPTKAPVKETPTEQPTYGSTPVFDQPTSPAVNRPNNPIADLPTDPPAHTRRPTTAPTRPPAPVHHPRPAPTKNPTPRPTPAHPSVLPHPPAPTVTKTPPRPMPSRTSPRPTGAVPVPTPTRPPVRARIINGRTIETRWGPVQVRVVIVGRTMIAISPLQYPSDNPRSQQISAAALPRLTQQALIAQSANIAGVSGATYTSHGYQQSLQSVIDFANR